MNFCAWDIYGSYMLAPKDMFLESVNKRQVIQSQVASITLFTLEFQFLFSVHNDERYLSIESTVMRNEKLNRPDHFNSNNTC